MIQFINKYIFQWFFFRLAKYTFNGVTDSYVIQIPVIPFTGFKTETKPDWYCGFVVFVRQKYSKKVLKRMSEAVISGAKAGMKFRRTIETKHKKRIILL